MLLVVLRSRLWRVDLTSGEVFLDHVIPDGRTVLALSKITSRTTNTDWLVFGEYFHNPERAEVRLWRRRCLPAAEWEIAGRFPAGEIEHVHGIHQLSDGSVYILAGDFGKAASVWRTNGDLGDLRPLMRGDQQFRACWWFEREGRVVYGTDSQFEINKLLSIKPGEQVSEKIADLPGSCIYHGRTGADLVFSTTVEPGASTGNFARDAISRAVGPGITGDPAIYLYTGVLSKLLSSPKDGWPSRLGQFGTFMFPAGATPDNRLYAYGVAVKRYDGDCLVFTRS